MAAVPFQHASTTLDLKPSPIEPSWIISGDPQARVSEICRSPDQLSFTVVWDCTAGTFTWTYGCDETIHILEGAIVLTDGGNPPTRLTAGDVVFFPKGSHVHWQVEGYVKKVAFFRRVTPNPLNIVYKPLRRLKMRLRGGPVADPMGSAGRPTTLTA